MKPGERSTIAAVTVRGREWRIVRSEHPAEVLLVNPDGKPAGSFLSISEQAKRERRMSEQHGERAAVLEAMCAVLR